MRHAGPAVAAAGAGEPNEDEPRALDLSVVIPALDEAPNLLALLPGLVEVLAGTGVRYEILVVTRGADPETLTVAGTCGAAVLEQALPGYGGALLAGFEASKGELLVTMDADLSHRPSVVDDLLRAAEGADIVVASRYVPGGRARMPVFRSVLSRTLNAVFRRGISVPIRDLSSGFRLYRASVVRGRSFVSRDFDLLEEILVKAFCEGWRVKEIPFSYEPRGHGRSNARLVRVGRAYVRTFARLWALRNSIEAADYDDRAFDSVIPLQRYWQRTRYRHVVELTAGAGPVLDVGCGSSRILAALPEGSVAVDVLARKLRYARKFGLPLVRASGFALPFPDGSFPCVLSSEVIEHVPKDSPMLDEVCRVVAPGGRLVIGTPDYARREWVYLEQLYARVAPGGYADEHIAHYTRAELISLLSARGFTHLATRYILRGELIMAFRKT